MIDRRAHADKKHVACSSSAVPIRRNQAGGRRHGRTYRSDLSGGASWKIRGTRFFVVTVANRDPPVAGAVFEAPDGTLFIFRSAGTRGEADIRAAETNPGTTIPFEVRPYWGMAATDWIAADPEFWKPNPMARSR